MGAVVLVGGVCVSVPPHGPGTAALLAVAAAAPPAPANAGSATAGSATAKLTAGERLDPRQALRDAQAAGMKTSIMVPYPVRCPELPPPRADAAALAARGELAGLLVDIDGFLREDVGVSEAAALLGRPVLCDKRPPGRYLNLYVAPRLPGLRSAMLETCDGELIGLLLELEKPVPVDLTALERKYGPSKRGMPPRDSREAGSDDLAIENPAFRAQVMLSHRAHADPPGARQVHRVILRRTARLRILPEGFRTEQDVARLLALALAERAPDPVEFAGTLGLYSQPVNGRIAYGSALPVRNVDRAATEIVTREGIHSVRTLTVGFKQPIPSTAAGLASSLATALKLPVPVPKTVSGRTVLDLKDAAGQARGTVLLDLAGGALTSVAIERFDRP